MAVNALAVSRWQTVEDGPPREGVDRWLRTDDDRGEYVLVAIPVRHPVTHGVMHAHAIVRAVQRTGEITLALERWELGDDGA